MLSKLKIQNYAIIEDVIFDFGENLNIITGETGAGKSIVLGALNLILGARADSRILYQPDQKCVVEAFFSISERLKLHLDSFEDFDIDDHQVIIRREVNSKGKSRAFINDTPVTLAVLRNTGSQLINLHQQFDTLDINDPEMQREYLDALAGNTDLRLPYHEQFQNYKQAQQELKLLIDQGKKSAEDLDYLIFQLDELKQAGLDDLDLGSLESDFKALNNAEEISQALNHLSEMIVDSEFNVSEQLSTLSKELQPLAEFHLKIEQIKDRLDDCSEELLSLQREAQNVSDDLEYDEDKINHLKDQLDLIYHLQKKHRQNDIAGLIELRDGIELRIEKNDNLDEHIESLKQNLIKLEGILEEMADKISNSRKEVSSHFAIEIQAILHKLSMQNARFEVGILPLPRFESHGKDDIEYLFSANQGIPLNPLNKIASGGELSRLALSIKSIIADKTNLPTMIFDEVDSGVSGQVALIMGQLINDLSQKYQIITITHSPQVAAHGHDHFVIFKEDKNERSYTRVRKLNYKERVDELAQMLGGHSPSEAAIRNAEELLKAH